MISLIPVKAWLAAGAVAIVLALVGWLRWDAAQDARAAIEAKANKARIEHLLGAKERRNDVETLDDTSLLDSLLGRVQPDGNN